MKIKIQQLSFKTGLNKNILLNEKNIDTKKQEYFFLYNHGIDADFSHNKPLTIANVLCLDIFKNLLKEKNLNIDLPPFVKVYKYSNLIDKNSAPNFCIPDTKLVLQNDYPFPGRSIFFKTIESLESLNSVVEMQYNLKQVSSPHVLAPIIHEWLHSMHLDFIYKNFGYGGNCAYLNEIYPEKEVSKNGYKILKELEQKHLSEKDNNIVRDILGNYSSQHHNQYLEIFAETFTKFICDSLHNCKLVKDPIEEIKKTPKDFQRILKNILSLK